MQNFMQTCNFPIHYKTPTHIYSRRKLKSSGNNKNRSNVEVFAQISQQDVRLSQATRTVRYVNASWRIYG